MSKKEILDLKKVFDDYDKDESGAISQQEWVQVMKERKQKAAPRPGQKSTLEERQQNEGISLMDVAGSAFGEMDVDGDGNVIFPSPPHASCAHALTCAIKAHPCLSTP